MKGKVLMSLFALPFAAVGAWMLWSVAAMLTDAYQMRDWRPIPAIIQDAGYRTHSGDKSDSYEAYARYRYQVDGVTHTGTRVGIGSDADNIGDYQRDTGNRLHRAQSRSRPITIYVNPDDPARAVIDRRVRWGMVGFESIFVLVFGGVGAGLMIYVWRGRREAAGRGGADAEAPWLARTDWRPPAGGRVATIQSGSRRVMWFAWFFAGIWNLVSAPMAALVPSEVLEKHNYPALVALLFPLIGIGLLAWAVRRTLEWRRFGLAPLHLDPFPGSIGGDVGGIIELVLPFASNRRFEVTLTCLRSYVSGSGRNRSRQESAKWQDSRLAHTEPGGRGTRVAFRFEVPTGLPESDAERRGNSYHLWRLNLRARLPGTDLDRDYDIPVYATAKASESLPDRALEETERRHRDESGHEAARRFQLGHSVSGSSLHFPMGRQRGAGSGILLVGTLLAGVGGFLLTRGDAIVIGSVFGLIGGLLASGGLYLLLNSLDVYRHGDDLVSVRKLLGLPIRTRRLRLDEFARLEPRVSLKAQSGGKYTIYYSIRAIDRHGHAVTVGEGFEGDSETRAAMELIARELRLDTQDDDAVLPSEIGIPA